jgi:hypothetical protein
MADFVPLPWINSGADAARTVSATAASDSGVINETPLDNKTMLLFDKKAAEKRIPSGE